MMGRGGGASLLAMTLVTGVFAAGCTPTVRVEAPKDPIVINLNVKIEQEVRVKVEKEAEHLIDDRPDLF